jgi:peroxiredoxin
MTDTLKEMKTNKGNNLYDLSMQHGVLVVFLRHFGCAFCREALHELGEQKKSLVKSGVKLVFVHMSDDETADLFFKKMGLGGIEHVSDIQSKYYSKFGLVKASFNQLFGLNNFIRGFTSGAFLGRYGIANIAGDAFQMPGVFAIAQGQIKSSFKHKLISDRPDYLQLVAAIHLDAVK